MLDVTFVTLTVTVIRNLIPANENHYPRKSPLCFQKYIIISIDRLLSCIVLRIAKTDRLYRMVLLITSAKNKRGTLFYSSSSYGSDCWVFCLMWTARCRVAISHSRELCSPSNIRRVKLESYCVKVGWYITPTETIWYVHILFCIFLSVLIYLFVIHQYLIADSVIGVIVSTHPTVSKHWRNTVIG